MCEKNLLSVQSLLKDKAITLSLLFQKDLIINWFAIDCVLFGGFLLSVEKTWRICAKE